MGQVAGPHGRAALAKAEIDLDGHFAALEMGGDWRFVIIGQRQAVGKRDRQRHLASTAPLLVEGRQRRDDLADQRYRDFGDGEDQSVERLAPDGLLEELQRLAACAALVAAFEYVGFLVVADDVIQFVQDYEKLKKTLLDDDHIVFMDGVHPTHAVRFTRGWIKKGVRREIPTNGSQKRLNILGALDLEKMTLKSQVYDTI